MSIQTQFSPMSRAVRVSRSIKVGCYSLEFVRTSTAIYTAGRVNNNDDAAHAVLALSEPFGLIDAQQERFCIMTLDSQNNPSAWLPVTVGTLNASLVHPREVFRLAIMAGAKSIILCHNHPSGDLTPSAEDRDVTNRLVEAGQLLGVPVLDHIVVGRDPVTLKPGAWSMMGKCACKLG
jgi:DNA repair protein RadC